MRKYLKRVRHDLLLFAVSCSLTVSGLGVLNAETSLPIPPAIYASSGGCYGLKVLPPSDGRGQVIGVLFTLDAFGEEKQIWRKELIHVSRRVIVFDNRQVLAFNPYAQLGEEHAMVVYDATGSVVADYKIGEIVQRKELSDQVGRSKTSRWWADGNRSRPGGRNSSKLVWT